MKVLEKYTGFAGDGRIDLKKDDKYILCRVSRWLSIHPIEDATKKEKEEMEDYADPDNCDFVRFHGHAIPISSLIACGTMFNPYVVAYKEYGKLNYISAFCDGFDIFHSFYVELDEISEHVRFYVDCE